MKAGGSETSNQGHKLEDSGLHQGMVRQILKRSLESLQEYAGTNNPRRW